MAPTIRHVMLMAWCAVMLPLSCSASTSADGLVSRHSGFIANQGQWPDSVCFLARSSGVSMWFCDGGAHYYLGRPVSSPDPDALSQLDQLTVAVQSLHVALGWDHGASTGNVAGTGRRDERFHIFRGADDHDWRSDIAVYDTITYRDVYPGIDLRYYFNAEKLEYDFIAAPGADISLIQLQYTGIDSISVTGDGRLAVSSDFGTFFEAPPRVYQPSMPADAALPAKFCLRGNGRFGFELRAGYNPALALSIDPVVDFSSYMGGGDVDHISSLALAEDGSICMTGATSSIDFPYVRPGSQALLSSDIFVTRLSADGQTVLSTTIFGGTAEDAGFDTALLPDGSICVVGKTSSLDFPQVDSLQARGGGDEAFVVRLAATGDLLLFSSYLGGSGMDKAVAAAVGSGGDLWLYGETDSPDFPTVSPITGDLGDVDLFLTHIAVDSPVILFSTYFGGDDRDHAGDMSIGSDGSLYFVGQTQSSNYPTARAFDNHLAGLDGFITRLEDDPPAVVYSSYLSGTDEENLKGVDVDFLGRAFVVGYTYSDNYPLVHPAQPNLAGSDMVVSVVAADGTRLEFSTYLGGSGEEAGYDIDVAPAGDFVVTGISSSEDFPSVRSLQSASGSYDIPICHMAPDSLGIIFSSLFGGDGFDNGTSVVLDGGSILLGGYTTSDNFPTFLPLQATLDGSSDGVVSYIQCCLGRRGDIDYKGGPPTEVDSSDLGTLVSYLFSPPLTVPLPCITETDVNGSGGQNPIDSSDLGILVSYLFSPPGTVTLQLCP